MNQANARAEAPGEEDAARETAADRGPGIRDAAEPSLLERLGLRYILRRSERLPPAEDLDGIHFLNEDERRALQRIERGMVARAAAAGALSAFGAALVELWWTGRIGMDPADSSLWETLELWLLLGPAIGVFTAAEIGFLYWDSLRSVHDLTRAAGLNFEGDEAAREEAQTVALSMARAALELPNPTSGRWGIDPHREVSKLGMILVTALYKLKIGLTSFVLKTLIRRLLGRIVLRVWLVFVAVPVTAFWDAAVAFRVIREARIRVMGPSAARSLLELLLTPAIAAGISAQGKLALLRAVGGSIVRTHDRHPNHLALFDEVVRRLGPPGPEDLDDTSAFLASLPELDADERAIALRVLAIAAMIDGRLTRHERRLIEEARLASGLDRSTAGIEALRRRFIRGETMQIEHLDAAAT